MNNLLIGIHQSHHTSSTMQCNPTSVGECSRSGAVAAVRDGLLVAILCALPQDHRVHRAQQGRSQRYTPFRQLIIMIK